MITPLDIVLNIAKITQIAPTTKVPDDLMFPHINLILFSNSNFAFDMNQGHQGLLLFFYFSLLGLKYFSWARSQRMLLRLCCLRRKMVMVCDFQIIIYRIMLFFVRVPWIFLQQMSTKSAIALRKLAKSMNRRILQLTCWLILYCT